MRIKMAELLGWADCHESIGSVYGFPAERKLIGIPPDRILHQEIPYFPRSLDATHEAELWLAKQVNADGGSRMPWYRHVLAQVCARSEHPCDPVHASAHQRTETFLRVFKQWLPDDTAQA